MKFNWLTVLRDVLMVLVIGTFGTLLVDFLVGGTPGLPVGAPRLGDPGGLQGEAVLPGQVFLMIFMLTVGFCISGCLARQGRFKHLAVVALGVWLLRLAEGVIRRPDYIPSMVLGLGIVLVAMLVGGLLSLAIVRPGDAAAPPTPET